MKYYCEDKEEVLRELNSPEGGLSDEEAAKRLAENGPNKLQAEKGKSLIRRFLEQLCDPMILILLAAALVSGILAVVQNDSFTDVIIILAVVLVNAILGVYQENKAEKAIDALQKMAAATSKVLRGGKIELVRSEERASYPDLTDEQYANFRAVTTTGMGEGKLYRSSSPVNPEINRNKEADAAAAAAGVKTFVNLADNEESMKAYEGFADSYYAGQAVICLNLGVDFAADDFKAGLAEGLRFIAANEAPFLVHCNEGKDRAGFMAAVLEALMGANADEITADYMMTFYNFYGVQPGTEQYDVIAASNIQKSLAAAFHMTSIFEGDLQAAAVAYLAEIGVSAEDSAAVQAKLAD